MILSAVPNFPIAASFEMDNILYVTRLSSSYRWVLSKLKKKKKKNFVSSMLFHGSF